MKLKDKTIYKNRDGKEIVIMGPTKNYPDLVWSLQGDWYDRETGMEIVNWSGPGKDIPEAFPLGSHWGDLIEEVGPYA